MITLPEYTHFFLSHSFHFSILSNWCSSYFNPRHYWAYRRCVYQSPIISVFFYHSLDHHKLTCVLEDQSLDHLPPSLKTFNAKGTFGTHNFDNLPDGLLELSLSPIFNSPIDDLPPFLTSLTIGDLFNQPIDPYLLLWRAFILDLNVNLINQLKTFLPLSNHYHLDHAFLIIWRTFLPSYLSHHHVS